jgi:hypothetical protein
LCKPLSRSLRQAIWRSYEAHLVSLTFALKKERQANTESQLDELPVIIALSAFNRLVMLQMRGFAKFGRQLSTRHDIGSLRIGRDIFGSEDFEELRSITVAYQKRMQWIGIPKYMLEYSDVPALLRMYDRERLRTVE